MNNSRENLVTQAEKIVDSYSRKIRKNKEKSPALLLSILGLSAAGVVFAGLYLIFGI